MYMHISGKKPEMSKESNDLSGFQLESSKYRVINVM